MKNANALKLTLAAIATVVPGLAPSAFAASDVTTGTKTVTITVPARMTLDIDTAAVALTADPADGSGVTDNQTSGGTSATVTVKTNHATALFLKVHASAPTDSSNTIALSNFKFKHNSTSAGLDSSVNVDAGSDWTAFTDLTSPTKIATLTGRSNGTTLKYDYAVDRSWAYASGSYTSVVTYTLATN